MRRASECIPGRNSKLTPRRLSLRFFDLRRARAAPASSFFVCVCVDGVTKSRTLVSYKVDISDGSGCDCFVSLFANDAAQNVGAVRSARKKGGVSAHSSNVNAHPHRPDPRVRVILIEPRQSFISRVVSAFVCVCSSSSLNRLVLRAEPRPPFVRAHSGANPATSSSSSSSQSQPLINPSLNPYVANDIASIG